MDAVLRRVPDIWLVFIAFTMLLAVYVFLLVRGLDSTLVATLLTGAFSALITVATSRNRQTATGDVVNTKLVTETEK